MKGIAENQVACDKCGGLGIHPDLPGAKCSRCAGTGFIPFVKRVPRAFPVAHRGCILPSLEADSRRNLARARQIEQDARLARARPKRRRAKTAKQDEPKKEGLTMKARDRERESALEDLRKTLRPGETVYTVLRHVSRSGMSRVIDCYIINDNTPHWLSYRIAKALGWTFSNKPEGIKVGGCGMDMGFHIVNSLSGALFPDGMTCLGPVEGCHHSPTHTEINECSDHVSFPRDREPAGNDRDYTVGHQQSKGAGAYALRHRWI